MINIFIQPIFTSSLPAEQHELVFAACTFSYPVSLRDRITTTNQISTLVLKYQSSHQEFISLLSVYANHVLKVVAFAFVHSKRRNATSNKQRRSRNALGGFVNG